MITHGHGDGAYADLLLDLWPCIPNFTISSLARCIRRLEKPVVCNSRELLEEPSLNAFFEILLKGKSRCMESILLSTNCNDHCNLLPKTLYLQLDNWGRTIRTNIYFHFCHCLQQEKYSRRYDWVSLWLAIYMKTLMDTSATFVEVLKENNTFVLADLIKHFMNSQHLPFMPHFIHEDADFKAYMKKCVHKLEGMQNKYIFRFFVNDDGVLVY